MSKYYTKRNRAGFIIYWNPICLTPA